MDSASIWTSAQQHEGGRVFAGVVLVLESHGIAVCSLEEIFESDAGGER